MSVDLDFITTRPMPFKALDRKTDYISRESLLKRIDGIWDCADMVFEPNDKCCRKDDCASCKWRETKNAIRKIAANIPAADVVPVVRCKDCKYGQGAKMDFWNEYEGIECIGGVVHRKDWFCADGAKREES